MSINGRNHFDRSLKGYGITIIQKLIVRQSDKSMKPCLFYNIRCYVVIE